MRHNEHAALKHRATDSDTDGRTRGRGSTESKTEVQDGTWIGPEARPGGHSPADGQKPTGQLVTDGGQPTTDDLHDALSFVISSQYRVTVIDALRSGPATPSTIAEESGDGIAHVSRALTRMRDRGIVELLVPDERKRGRLYGLSDRGTALAQNHGDTLARERDANQPDATTDGGLFNRVTGLVGDDQGLPSVDISLTDLGTIVDNVRRRYVVRQVAYAKDGVALDIGPMSRDLAAVEHDCRRHEITSKQRKAVYVGLYQCHIPKLDQLGVIEAVNSGTAVRSTEQTAPVAAVLDRLDELTVEKSAADTVPTTPGELAREGGDADV